MFYSRPVTFFIKFILCFSFTVSITLADKLELEKVRSAIKQKGAKWTAGETFVSKLSKKERKNLHGVVISENKDRQKFQTFNNLSFSSLPSSLDWRNNGGVNFVTDVRHQGYTCGSCWAHATVAALESSLLIAGYYDRNLNNSEQILISCSGLNGCSGSDPYLASLFISSTGIPAETSFPYSGTSGSCSDALPGWMNHVDVINNVNFINKNLVDIKSALANYGPLVVTFNIYSDFYYYYSPSGGVYEYVFGDFVDDHSSLLVGYTDDPSFSGGGYFIVKNSWGVEWGEQGYFRIAYSELDSVVQFGLQTLAYASPYAYNPAPSSAVTGSAFPIAGSSATLNGTVNPNGTNTFITFDYGETPSYDFSTEAEQSPLSAIGITSVSKVISGLAPNTTYHYRLRAFNSNGTVYGSDQTFTTSSQPSVIVSRAGAGIGTVTSIPSGINCGATCLATFAPGTTVTLQASPSANSAFSGWSGGNCTGTGNCTFTMGSEAQVTATFNLLPAVADFSASPASGNAPLTVSFADLSQYASTWFWEFGDGATDLLHSPSHTYTTPGTYSVSLYVANPASYDIKTNLVYVAPLIRNLNISSSFYNSLQSAFDASLDAQTIQAQAMTFIEDLNINRSVGIALDGGYNLEFSENSGFTVIGGSLTVTDGEVTIKNIAIQ